MLMRRRELGSGIKGAVVAILVAVLWVFAPASLTDRFNHTISDAIESLAAPPDTDRVLVVDIDSPKAKCVMGYDLMTIRPIYRQRC
mgnify:CR=1 FL=1